MANKSVRIDGSKELEDFFKRFPKQLNNPKNKTKVFRENSKPLIKKAKDLVVDETGQLRDSIGFFTTKASRRVGGGFVGPRVRGVYRSMQKTGFYGAFVEYGATTNFGGKGPTQKGNQEFMKPAYEQTKNIMLSNMLRDSRKMMLREAKKLRKWGTLGYK